MAKKEHKLGYFCYGKGEEFKLRITVEADTPRDLIYNLTLAIKQVLELERMEEYESSKESK